MSGKYFDENGNSLLPDSFDKEDRDEAVLLQRFYKQKRNNTRPRPSDKFINQGPSLTAEARSKIVDLAGKLCDEDMLMGRMALCQQFALLVKYMLKKEGIDAKVYTGNVKYFNGVQEFTWKHFWVEIDETEVIDCNVDSMIDNHLVPAYLEPINYWGTKENIPNDREFQTRLEFTEEQERELEEYDPETLEWKKVIDKEF